MPYYFFDTSALVKRYHDEVGTDTVDSVIEDEANTTVISSLAVIEATSAFRKRYNSGDLSEAGMRDLLTTFFDEALNDFVIVPMNDVALERDSTSSCVTTFARLIVSSFPPHSRSTLTWRAVRSFVQTWS
jgi:predicted nucleic acid-binding protein